MVLLPLKLPEGNVSVLQAKTTAVGVPPVLFSLPSGPSLVVKVVPVGVAAIVLTPLQLSKTPPEKPSMLTCAPACKLCVALDVYVAMPLARTQLVSVTEFVPIVAAPVVVVPAV